MKITITEEDVFHLGNLLYQWGIQASFYGLVGTYEIKRTKDGVLITPVVRKLSDILNERN